MSESTSRGVSLLFEPWPSANDIFGQSPQGTYSRLAWLPAIGPTTWLLWGTVTAILDSRRYDDGCGRVVIDADALARSLGLQSRSEHRWRLHRSLTRLCQFSLARAADGVLQVRCNAPPVSATILDRLPACVQARHSCIFESQRSSRVGGA